MKIILSILLYLNVISSPRVYTVSEIKHDVEINQDRIVVIKNDSALLQNIVDTYRDRVSGITVLDDGQLK